MSMSQAPSGRPIKTMVVSNSTFGPREIQKSPKPSPQTTTTTVRFAKALARPGATSSNRSPAASARLGVCQYLLGATPTPFETLKHMRWRCP